MKTWVCQKVLMIIKSKSNAQKLGHLVYFINVNTTVLKIQTVKTHKHVSNNVKEVRKYKNKYKPIQGLDDYFEFKKKQLIQNKVFYALPRYESTPVKKNYIIPEKSQFEYQDTCIAYEQEAKNKLKNLQQFLQDQEKLYQSQKGNQK